MHNLDLAASCLAFGFACLVIATTITKRSTTRMNPQSFTVVNAIGPHDTVVLFPQPYGRGIDRNGNEYRIRGDAAYPINPED